jgi:hypothetical protein
MLQQEGFKFHLDTKNNKALPLDPAYGHNESAPLHHEGWMINGLKKQICHVSIP